MKLNESEKNPENFAKLCNDKDQRKTTENLSNNSYDNVFLQTLVVQLKGLHETRHVRALIDTGSQMSYIKRSTADALELQKLGEEEIVHLLFGGLQSGIVSHLCYKICLSNIDSSYECNLEVLDQPVICGEVVSVPDGPWMEELRNLKINISDIGQGPIEILFGADVAGKILCGPRFVLKCGLVAMKTVLGWTLMGKTKVPQRDNDYSSSPILLSMLNSSINIPDLWNLDVLGIADPNERQSEKEHEKMIMKFFNDTVHRKDDGRYVVRMPWIENHPPLPNNVQMAKNRLNSLICRLKKDRFYLEYDKVLDEWLEEEIIERIPIEKLGDEKCYYLPHHHVIKIDSATTKLRPVFDASAKLHNHPSLNHCLEKGINLIMLIPSILLNFRWNKIGVISDIRKAFLQIVLHEEERDFLRFLWYKNEELVIFRHARVVFGVTCSPFLLSAVINHHLEYFEGEYSEDVVKKLKNSFYVDNCVSSVKSEEELKKFIEEAQQIMTLGKFDLRGWEFTGQAEMSPVLGLHWDKNMDTLSLKFDAIKKENLGPLTKKKILSITNKFYDPIGFSSPVLLRPKLLLQETWIFKLNWDVEVPKEIEERFMVWLNDVDDLPSLKIPRWLLQDNFGKLSFHVFCDASKSAYASIIFLRSECMDRIEIQLVQAKSRVAPLKHLSIPRLELLAATIGTRMMVSIFESLDKEIPIYFWTDSTTVLAWIKNREKWKPFVWNRVSEIRKLSAPENWCYVPGTLNPADISSRGCSVKYLIEKQWWKGPSWLYKTQKEWPQQHYSANSELVLAERNISISSLLIQTTNEFHWIYHHFSKYEKIVCLIGWILRFIFNCRHSSKCKEKQLSVEELSAAEVFLLKCVQSEGLVECEEKISSLVTLKDENGIVRIRTRISDRNDTENFRYPVLLPSKHPVVHRLIFDEHVKNSHVGVQGLLTILRENFWIVRAPAVLPLNRIRDARIFEVTGIDMFGPLHLRNKHKVWVCIFTCAVYRAIHLEIVSDLSTESFLLSFRRFVARRGRPKIVYSDNGTNFTGLENNLNTINFEDITKKHAIERIQWKFNPPTACWWGGWWERLIRLIKDLLRKVLGRACLHFDELSTLLCDCEATINNRPLTYVSEDSSDLETLTPSMFLQDLKEIGVPDFDKVEADKLRKRYRYRVRLMENLRARFRSEYLGELILRNKKFKNFNLKIGDVVLVENDKKRFEWPLARIEELLPGKDSQIRLVRLKTINGTILRPTQRIYKLEMDSAERKNILPPGNLMKTRSGRIVKAPQRLNS